MIAHDRFMMTDSDFPYSGCDLGGYEPCLLVDNSVTVSHSIWFILFAVQWMFHEPITVLMQTGIINVHENKLRRNHSKNHALTYVQMATVIIIGNTKKISSCLERIEFTTRKVRLCCDGRISFPKRFRFCPNASVRKFSARGLGRMAGIVAGAALETKGQNYT